MCTFPPIRAIYAIISSTCHELWHEFENPCRGKPMRTRLSTGPMHHEKDEDGKVTHWMARIKVFSAHTELDSEKVTKTDDSFRIVSPALVFADPLRTISHLMGPVCMSRHHRRMSASQLPKHWKGLWREGYPLHDFPFIPINRLRHANTTLMHEAEVSDFTISRTRGHKSPQMDYDHYLAPSSKQADLAALVVGELVGAESFA